LKKYFLNVFWKSLTQQSWPVKGKEETKKPGGKAKPEELGILSGG
jgi:hypothetical protein